MLTRFKVKTSLRVYTVIVKVSWDGEMIERVDVYDGEPYFKDGTFKFLGEAMWIGGWVDEPYTHTLKPVELAKQTIEEYERPQKLENYLRLKGHFLHINENEEELPRYEEPPRPEIYDHEEKSYKNFITHLIQNPQEIDELPEMERKRVLKENVELRLAYHEYRARQQAAQRQQQRAGGDK